MGTMRCSLVWLLACEHVVGTSIRAQPTRLLRLRSGEDMIRLRGGEDDEATALGLKPTQVTGRLSKEEVVEKLNRIPTFCIIQGDGAIISLPNPSSDGGECCTWFVDPHEAAETFRKVKAANPGESMRLVAHGLGDALQMCGGWPAADANEAAAAYDGTLRLAPHRDFVEPIKTQLVDSVRQEKLEPGTWVVPTFVGEELAQADADGAQRALPVYMSPYDLRDAYAKAGVLGESVAQSGPKVLELRVLVKHMLDEPKEYPNAWRAVEFVPTPAAVELARLLAEQAKA